VHTSVSEDERLIRVTAVVLRDDAGRILTVRKRGTDRFMLPGGKPEPGESAAEAGARECAEELGIELATEALEPIGVFRAAAANEPGFEVEGAIFAHAAPRVAEPAAEIEELRWLDASGELPDDLAPLLEHRILPELARRAGAGSGNADTRSEARGDVAHATLAPAAPEPRS